MGLEVLSRAQGLNDIARRCFSVFRSIDAPNLLLLAPGVLETSTSTPWAYAHNAKSIMSHITGGRCSPARRARPSRPTSTWSSCWLFDRTNYPFMLWYLKYLWLALRHPNAQPLPIP